MPASVRIVIPCFNEAERMDVAEVFQLLEAPEVSLVLVDDGSTDGTLSVFQKVKSTMGDRVEILSIPGNVGKAEAVRLGMQKAILLGGDVVGFMDGDFATPADEMLRLIAVLDQHENVAVLLGSRWLHLGARIERHLFRHYAGRVFATLASVVLGLKVYDTQCGAKLFRVSNHLELALDTTFISRWSFDVELIGRLRKALPESHFCEEALREWKDVKGSKISLPEMIRATFELVLIWRALRQWHT